jgi:hypothetical protein
MASSGMLRSVALVRTDVPEELGASFIRETRIGELGTTLAVTSNRKHRWLLVTVSVVPSSPILVSLMEKALSSSETSVLCEITRSTAYCKHGGPQTGLLFELRLFREQSDHGYTSQNVSLQE